MTYPPIPCPYKRPRLAPRHDWVRLRVEPGLPRAARVEEAASPFRLWRQLEETLTCRGVQ